MELRIYGYKRRIVIYGQKEPANLLSWQLERLGVHGEYAGSELGCLEALELSSELQVVIALSPTAKSGAACRAVISRFPELRDYVSSELEFLTSLIAQAKVVNPPEIIPCPEDCVLIGCNLDFVLGGVETWVSGIYHSLKHLGVTVKIYEQRQVSAYTYVGGAFYGVDENDIVRIGPYDYFLDYTLKSLEYAYAHPPRLYIDNGSMFSLGGFCHAKTQLSAPTKIVSVVHGDHEIFYNRVLSYQSCIDEFLTVSDTICNHLMALLPTRKANISMQVMLPPADASSLRDKINDGRLHIAYAARLESHNKRSMWVCDIARGLRGKHIPFVLHIAGEGECLEPLRDFCNREDFRNEVILYGMIQHKDMNCFYRDKHVFVNFSISEGMPLTLYEAMGCALVPIVTNTGSAVKLVNENENGFIICTPLEIVERLSSLAENRCLLELMQQRILQTYINVHKTASDRLLKSILKN